MSEKDARYPAADYSLPDKSIWRNIKDGNTRRDTFERKRSVPVRPELVHRA
jgi:hypothetical protein